MSRFSWWTAQQAGHLLFEIFVEVFAGSWRPAQRGSSFELNLGSDVDGSNFGSAFGSNFGSTRGLVIAQRRACTWVASFAQERRGKCPARGSVTGGRPSGAGERRSAASSCCAISARL